jgi:hypothetical protein
VKSGTRRARSISQAAQYRNLEIVKRELVFAVILFAKRRLKKSTVCSRQSQCRCYHVSYHVSQTECARLYTDDCGLDVRGIYYGYYGYYG